MIDDFWISGFKELVIFGPKVCVENSPYEYLERLAIATAFASNFIFKFGKTGCGGIHIIGYHLAAECEIAHAYTPVIVTYPFFGAHVRKAKISIAKSCWSVWKATGTEEAKPKSCIDNLRKLIAEIGQPLKVTDVKGCVVKPDDVEKTRKW
jgi:alcohol dehydrogenase YqhD (iron-dependent ADH family)